MSNCYVHVHGDVAGIPFPNWQGLNLSAQSAPVKVAIVEDHRVPREALCDALSHVPGIELGFVCRTLPDAIHALRCECPDVLLVDLGLPGGFGLVLIRQAWLLWGARCTCAVLTVMGSEVDLLAGVRAGAKGYVYKTAESDELRETVFALADGQSPLGSDVARMFLREGVARPAMHGGRDVSPTQAAKIDMTLQRLADGYTYAEMGDATGQNSEQVGRLVRGVYDRFFQPPPDLSGRELELMGLLGSGKALGDCDEPMGVAKNTIKTFAKRAYGKLGATNLQMAIYEARAAGLIP